MTYDERAKQAQRRRVLEGRQAEADARYKPKRKNFATSRNKRAHNLARKYGMTLPQMTRLGWYPPDVQEALHGDR